MDLAERKSRLREAMQARREALTAAEAEAAGAAVAARVAGLPEFAAARAVGLYAALGAEVPTRALFEAARRQGKAVRFPRVEGRDLVFAAVQRWEELRPGRYGVPEPPPEADAGGPGDLVLVPGLAFDRRGHRLGRGGGHYDRALASRAAKGAMRIGLAYEFQVVEVVPHGSGDQRLDGVVTERALYRADEASA